MLTAGFLQSLGTKLLVVTIQWRSQ